MTRSEDGSVIKCKVASYYDEDACLINLRIEFVDGPMRLDPVDIEDTGTVAVH